MLTRTLKLMACPSFDYTAPATAVADPEVWFAGDMASAEPEPITAIGDGAPAGPEAELWKAP